MESELQMIEKLRVQFGS